VWEWVHLVRRPLIGLLYQPRMIGDHECGAVGGMRIFRGNWSIRRKPGPMPLCPPQIPHYLTWARTRAAVVGSRRLTAWVTTRPYNTQVDNNNNNNNQDDQVWGILRSYLTNLTLLNQTDWFRDNALELCLESAWFESRLEHLLTWLEIYGDFSSVPRGTFGDNTSIRSLPVFSNPFQCFTRFIISLFEDT
jgi:hypothetical protein